MYTGLLHLHSTLRWVVLVLLILLVIRALSGRGGNRAFTAQDRKMVLILMITSHIQLLIGLYQYFVGNFGIKLFDNFSMGELMKNSLARFFAIEHVFGMVCAIALVTVANVFSKKPIDDKAKWNRLFWLYTITLLIILFTIPWPFRAEIGAGRAWFPGM